MGIESLIAQFGQNTGSGISAGINRGIERRDRNRLAELARQERQGVRDAQAAQEREKAEEAYYKERAAAIYSLPPEQRAAAYQGMRQGAEQRGYDLEGAPETWSEDYMPVMMGLAGMEIPKAKTDSIGTYNPRDYTVESFAEFRRTGDPGKLQRYEASRTVESGGVTYAFDPASDSFKPLRSAEDVAKDRRTIKTEEAAGAAEGKRSVESRDPEALGNMRAELDEMDRAIGEVDGLINHPGRERATGFSSIIPTRPGSEARDFGQRLDKLRGMAFLIQREKLKGSGSVTDFESNKAEQALAALDEGMSEEGLVNELRSISEIFRNIRDRKAARLQELEGGSEQAAPTETQPTAVNWSDL